MTRDEQVAGLGPYDEAFTVCATFSERLETLGGCAGAIPVLGPMNGNATRRKRAEVAVLEGSMVPGAPGEAVIGAGTKLAIGKVSYDQIMTCMATWQDERSPDIEVNPGEHDAMEATHRRWAGDARRHAGEVLDIEVTFAEDTTLDERVHRGLARALATGGVRTLRGGIEGDVAMGGTVITCAGIAAGEAEWALRPCNDAGAVQGRVLRGARAEQAQEAHDERLRAKWRVNGLFWGEIRVGGVREDAERLWDGYFTLGRGQQGMETESTGYIEPEYARAWVEAQWEAFKAKAGMGPEHAR